jgi:hypothetical protein
MQGLGYPTSNIRKFCRPWGTFYRGQNICLEMYSMLTPNPNPTETKACFTYRCTISQSQRCIQHRWKYPPPAGVKICQPQSDAQQTSITSTTYRCKIRRPQSYILDCLIHPPPTHVNSADPQSYILYALHQSSLHKQHFCFEEKLLQQFWQHGKLGQKASSDKWFNSLQTRRFPLSPSRPDQFWAHPASYPTTTLRRQGGWGVGSPLDIKCRSYEYIELYS